MTIVISIYNPYTSIQLIIGSEAFQMSLHKWGGIYLQDAVKWNDESTGEAKLTLGFVSWGIRDI